jgi:hypothetical protein
MDEHQHRSVRLLSLIEVEPLDLGRPVFHALGLVEQALRDPVVEDTTFADVLCIKGIDVVVVALVDVGLVEAHEHRRTLDARRWLRTALR